MKEQRRARKIAMDPAELNDFLGRQHTCRVATASPQGPHLTALWYVWDGSALWLTSLVKSQRWTDLEREPRGGGGIAAGEQYGALRRAARRGGRPLVGEVPRTGRPDETLAEPERLMAAKYGGPGNDGRHAWLRLVPDKITSWDFRKLP